MTDEHGAAPGRRLEREIAVGLDALGEPAGGNVVARLARLVDELARWSRRVNLTAVREPRDMIALHLLDSLAVRPLVHGRRVLDVGTGGGFPGLPLAIVMPDRQFTLLDGNGKKIAFVRHMIGDLGLANADAVKARVEAFAPGPRFDTVVARAFAPLPRLVELAGHLVADNGRLVAMKGKYPADEIASLGDAGHGWNIDVSELTIPGLANHERHAAVLSRQPAEAG